MITEQKIDRSFCVCVCQNSYIWHLLINVGLLAHLAYSVWDTSPAEGGVRPRRGRGAPLRGACALRAQGASLWLILVYDYGYLYTLAGLSNPCPISVLSLVYLLTIFVLFMSCPNLRVRTRHK